MRKFGYLVVEGPHDVEFCYRLLRHTGLERIRKLSELDPFFKDLIPTKFPHDDDLQKRMPVPLFLQNTTHAIAIHSATGESKLVATLEETCALLDPSRWAGIGLVLDADSQKTPAQRFAKICDSLRDTTSLPVPAAAGVVTKGSPRVGAYVMPDNHGTGTLEDLLLECAARQFPQLLPHATQYVAAALGAGVVTQAQHLDDIRKPAGQNKAVVGAMATIFRPGKAVQMSIQDNDWVRGDALTLPRIKAMQDFLLQLFDMQSA